MAAPEATPMSNADFRSLMSSSRGKDSKKRSHNDDGNGGAGAGGETAKKKRPYRPKPQPRGGYDDDDRPEYDPDRITDAERHAMLMKGHRDRAQERREGVNLDYVGLDDKFGTQEDLGGDVNQTHLVKGLDRSLLAKVREELEAKERKKEKKKERKLAEQQQQENSKSIVIEEDAPKFKTVMGRALQARLDFRPSASTDLFLPGRTAFVYELDSDLSMDNDIPTTLSRSKVEVSKMEEKRPVEVPQEVLTDICKIISLVRQGSFRPGRTKKQKPGGSTAMPPPCMPPPSQPAPEPKPRVDLPPPPPPPPTESIFEDAPSVYVPEVVEPKPKKPLPKATQDVYAECYIPGDEMISYSRVLDGSDSEEEGTATGKRRKRREDFATDEEYRAYREVQQMANALGTAGSVRLADFKKDDRREKQAQRMKKVKDRQRLDRDHSKVMNILSKKDRSELGKKPSQIGAGKAPKQSTDGCGENDD